MTDRIVVTGGSGILGSALTRSYRDSGVVATALSHSDLDVTDAGAVTRVVADLRPTILINCAAYTNVDAAELAETIAYSVNRHGALHLANACDLVGAQCVYPSTDYVFDGNAATPYSPAAPTNPLNAYGRTKLAGELATRTAKRHLIVRTSWLYGTGGRNFVRSTAEKVARGVPMRVVDDQIGRLSCADDVARGIRRLIEAAPPAGVYHVCNSGVATRFQVARFVARSHSAEAIVSPCRTGEYPTAARRPLYSVLDTSAADALIGPLPDWEVALAEALASGSY